MRRSGRVDERVVDMSVRTARIVAEEGQDTGERVPLLSEHIQGGRGIQAAFEAFWREIDEEKDQDGGESNDEE